LCLRQAINHEFLTGNGHIFAELDPPEGGYHWRPAINIENRQISTEIPRRVGGIGDVRPVEQVVDELHSDADDNWEQFDSDRGE
jgi:hypothetical protein